MRVKQGITNRRRHALSFAGKRSASAPIVVFLICGRIAWYAVEDCVAFV